MRELKRCVVIFTALLYGTKMDREGMQEDTNISAIIFLLP